MDVLFKNQFPSGFEIYFLLLYALKYFSAESMGEVLNLTIYLRIHLMPGGY